MKRIAIFAVAAATMLAGVAITPASWADDVVVETPKDPASKEQAAIYVAELDQAVRHVCARALAPIIGVNFYTYRACLKETRAVTAKKDPTGLYAGSDSLAGTVIAAR